MPNKTKSKRQLAIVKKPDTIGAVISAPKGTPIKPRADNKPRSLGAQFALVLLIVEKIGPSEIPKSTRSKPNPAMAEPPNIAIPSSPAKAIAISTKDQAVPANIQTNLGPFYRQ